MGCWCLNICPMFLTVRSLSTIASESYDLRHLFEFWGTCSSSVTRSEPWPCATLYGVGLGCPSDDGLGCLPATSTNLNKSPLSIADLLYAFHSQQFRSEKVHLSPAAPAFSSHAQKSRLAFASRHRATHNAQTSIARTPAF